MRYAHRDAPRPLCAPQVKPPCLNKKAALARPATPYMEHSMASAKGKPRMSLVKWIT